MKTKVNPISLIIFRLSKQPEFKDKVTELQEGILKRKAHLHEIEQTLPKKNGTYLKIILGNVNVSILNREEKWVWKCFNRSK